MVDELGRANLVYQADVARALDFIDEATDQGLVILGGQGFFTFSWVCELLDSMMPSADT